VIVITRELLLQTLHDNTVATYYTVKLYRYIIYTETVCTVQLLPYNNNAV